MLSPAGAHARLTVLIFHRVLAEPDPLFPGEPDASRFETQMRWVKAWFNVLPLTEAVERLRTSTLPARAASITFDDGYADNCTVALPILQRVGLHATFFIATGYLDGGRMWNDTVIETVRGAKGADIDLTLLGLGRHTINTIENRQIAVRKLLGMLKYLEPSSREQLANSLAEVARIQPPRDLMLTADQVRKLYISGMTIGAHTVSHPILSCVSDEQARAELVQSKKQLEAVIGDEVMLFAYPNGKPAVDYTAVHVHLVRESGFLAAVSTGWGAASRNSDVFQIPRFTPWDRQRWRYALRLAGNMRGAVVIAH